jgi:putative transposase
VRAKLARQAAAWRYGSEHVRQGKDTPLRAILSEWPVERSRQWSRFVDEPQTDEELAEVRLAVKRSRPFGDAEWTKTTAERIGLDWTLNPHGSPRKSK